MPTAPTSDTSPQTIPAPPLVVIPTPHEAPNAAEDSHVHHRDTADEKFLLQLQSLSEVDDDYWTFRGRAARLRTQGLTQYPAMMVPAMQAVLIGMVMDADDDIETVCDPFAGSGTTLVESMRLGINYVGQDINPLAILLCRTKAGPFHIRRLASAVNAVIDKAQRDRVRKIEADFPGMEKWFSPKAMTELSRVRRAIRTIDHPWCRRVLWTALAETVRLTSNSRTSTFKLHIRSREELDSRNPSPIETFTNVIKDITNKIFEEANALREVGHISSNGYYRGDVSILLGDSTNSFPAHPTPNLLVTSPPYGDNTTTVPYGQYSYLPLQWIDLEDIHEDIDPYCLCSTHELDTRSLGGSKKNALSSVKSLRKCSPTLNATLHRLEQLPPDRAAKVAAFFRDLDASLRVALNTLKPNSYMLWTLGNRRVGGHSVPSDLILKELLALRRVRFLKKIERNIPSKRMATRNTVSSTMRKESILVFKAL